MACNLRGIGREINYSSHFVFGQFGEFLKTGYDDAQSAEDRPYFGACFLQVVCRLSQACEKFAF